jgi:hypothetical protein
MAEYSFGDWTVDTINFLIDHRHPSYPIPMGLLLDPVKILELLVQVNTKTWATPETVGNLLKAMEYCVGLQGNVCGGGTARTKAFEKIKARLVHPPRQA